MNRKEERKAIRHKPYGICEMCGESTALEAHHKVPLSLGGTNDAANIILLCHDCHKNSHKFNQSECVKAGMKDAKEKAHDLLISRYELESKIMDYIVDADGKVKAVDILDIIRECDIKSYSTKPSGISERLSSWAQSSAGFLKWLET